jgi:secondary thiamine-phosphate synthase enzyme
MGHHTLHIKSGKRTEFVDITASIAAILKDDGVRDGMCVVFVPHTTAGVTINEAADPAVKRDMLASLDKLIPLEDGYTHGEGNSAAHIKASLMGSSVSMPVTGGRLNLGTWQGVYFCEFDGPRSRHLVCSFFDV